MTDRDLFEEGLNFFNAGKYYEAHEVWEDAWRLEEGPRRRFYQGLIQAAVGLYHLSRANTTGARSQLGKSIRNLGDHASAEHRIDTPNLIAQLNAVRDEMRIRDVRIARLK
jgi:predicted metal-dependent hydrolase